MVGNANDADGNGEASHPSLQSVARIRSVEVLIGISLDAGRKRGEVIRLLRDHGIGVKFSRRLTRPLEEVKEAAQRAGYIEVKCAICGTQFETASDIKTDHDHLSGRPRDFLCNNCNLGLGHFKDDPILLEQAGRYLRKHQRKIKRLSGQATHFLTLTGIHEHFHLPYREYRRDTKEGIFPKSCGTDDDGKPFWDISDLRAYFRRRIYRARLKRAEKTKENVSATLLGDAR